MARLCALICACILSACVCACDPLKFLDKYTVAPPPPSAPKKEKDSDVLPVERVTAVYRADLMRVIVNSQTNLLHVAGICAPSHKRGAANDMLAQTHGLVSDALPLQARDGITYVTHLASNDVLKLIIFEWRTNSVNEPYIEGDILCGGIDPLSGRLLDRGLAAVQMPVPRTVVLYEELQTLAQEAEKGMWSCAIPLTRRLIADSSFSISTLSSTKNDVFTGSVNAPRRLLESHVTVEKCGQIALNLRAAKPMWHSYQLTIRYAFRSKVDEGHGAGYDENKPATASSGATTTAAKTVAKPVMSSLSFVLASPETNMVIESPAVAYTTSTKGTTTYGIGEVMAGYDLEVWYATNMVYSHYHK